MPWFAMGCRLCSKLTLDIRVVGSTGSGLQAVLQVKNFILMWC